MNRKASSKAAIGHCNHCASENKPSGGWPESVIALLIALAIISFLIFIQKAGFIQIAAGQSVSYGAAFLVGLVASFSSCGAVVGGLILSLSASTAQRKGLEGTRDLALFHGGRLLSFFLLGGLVGLIGSVFQLSGFMSAALSIAIGIIMFVLGLRLVGVHLWSRGHIVVLPKALSCKAIEVSGYCGKAAPLLIGVATFFLPCGFTQSMQAYALSTGSFLSGGLTMLAFSLGTLPALVLVSAGSLALGKSSRSGIFFKTAGMIVVAFAVLGIWTGLSGAGLVPQSRGLAAYPVGAALVEGKQVIEIAVSGGYTPSRIKARPDVPTILRMKSSGSFDCSSAVAIPSLGVSRRLRPSGEEDIEIPPQTAGTRLRGSCSMGMYRFEIDFTG